jgi:TorA maturation chaperone TorD
MQTSSQEAAMYKESAATQESPVSLPEEQARRAGIYSILAALLRSAPEQPLLDHLGGLDVTAGGNGNELLLSLSMLALACGDFDPRSIASEYHDLFIGIGRGELVPYGSWYQTGYLMEKPLSELRNDLKRLGFARDESHKEPEDHVAALFEVMEMLILDAVSIEEQAAFYDAHMGSWCGKFFSDLANAQGATFYRSVARFGSAFCDIESRYLQMTA